MVAGLSWKLSGEGGIQTEAFEQCATVKALAAGKSTVIVEAGGFKKSFPLTVVAAAKGEAPAEKAPLPSRVSSGSAPGERAVSR